MKKFHLTKGDGNDIGFVDASFFYGAITFVEFKEWLYYVIEHSEVDDIPSYFFDLIDLKDRSNFLSQHYNIIGYVSGWNATRRQSYALEGIAYKRFIDNKSDAVSRDKALKALSENPDVEEKFRQTFPFIDW